MSARHTDLMEVVARYAAGYFPLYDAAGRFYWERPNLRAILAVNSETVERAERLSRRHRKKFQIRYSSAIDAVIDHLRDESIKQNSWVQKEVVAIYGAFRAAGLLQTIEAWRGNTLVGALLGIVLPGTFIAETMFGLEPDASKVCLCQLVRDCAAQGFFMIDVQTPHDGRHLYGISFDEFLGENQLPIEIGRSAHPCMRLGEIHLPFPTFGTHFRRAWIRSFAGNVADWIAIAQRRYQNPGAEIDAQAKLMLCHCAMESGDAFAE